MGLIGMKYGQHHRKSEPSRLKAGEPKKTLMLHCYSVSSRGMAQKLDEKKSITKHIPNEANIPDIGTMGLTDDRRWKLMKKWE